jgi:hypothetical protein
MPEIVRRSSTRRAPGWFVGMNGSITAHCASDNQNRPVISTSSLTAGATESDSLSLRNTLIEF